jgi:hypothetical protein
MDVDKFAAAGYAPPRNLTGCVVGAPGCAGTTAQLSLNRLRLEEAGRGPRSSYTVHRSTGTTFSLTRPETYIIDARRTTFVESGEAAERAAYTYVIKATFAEAGGGTSVADASR